MPTELAEMASAMAQALGMSEEEARLLVDAMSRGGPDARTLAEGVNALRGMPRAGRTDWLNAWLPSAKAAASVIVTLADTTTARSLGVSDPMVEALAEAAERTFMMVNRGRSGLVDGMTVAEGAERIRKQTEKRVGSAKGADAILSEVAGLSEAIANARAELRKAEDELELAEENQRAFVTDVPSRYDVTFDQAKSWPSSTRSWRTI